MGYQVAPSAPIGIQTVNAVIINGDDSPVPTLVMNSSVPTLVKNDLQNPVQVQTVGNPTAVNIIECTTILPVTIEP